MVFSFNNYTREAGADLLLEKHSLTPTYSAKISHCSRLPQKYDDFLSNIGGLLKDKVKSKRDEICLTLMTELCHKHLSLKSSKTGR